MSKLSPEAVREIKQFQAQYTADCLSAGRPPRCPRGSAKPMGRRMGVSHHTIKSVLWGKSWKSVSP